MTDNRLSEELAYRATIDGLDCVTVAEFNRRFRALGYRVDRRDDCRSNARYMSGPRAGASYPAISTGATHMASGLRYANADAPRDANFRAMMELRGSIFAVSKGAILEI